MDRVVSGVLVSHANCSRPTLYHNQPSSLGLTTGDTPYSQWNADPRTRAFVSMFPRVAFRFSFLVG